MNTEQKLKNRLEYIRQVVWAYGDTERLSTVGRTAKSALEKEISELEAALRPNNRHSVNELDNAIEQVKKCLKVYHAGNTTLQTYTIPLDCSVTITIGDSCDGEKELQSILFVDINDGLGVDISDFSKNGETLKQVLADKLPEVIMSKYRKVSRVDR